MKDLGEAQYVIGIKIIRDRNRDDNGVGIFGAPPSPVPNRTGLGA